MRCLCVTKGTVNVMANLTKYASHRSTSESQLSTFLSKQMVERASNQRKSSKKLCLYRRREKQKQISPPTVNFYETINSVEHTIQNVEEKI